MKKFFKEIVCAALVLALSLAVSVPAFVIEKTPSAASKSGIAEVSAEVKDISREEFLKTFANRKEVSLAEADRIDKLQTLKDNENEVAKNNNNKLSQLSAVSSSSITPMVTVYKQIKKTYDIGTAGNFGANIIITIQVKIQRYDSSSYGTYQKLTEVLSRDSSAAGTGVSTWSPAAQTTEIYNDTGYENQMIMMISGLLRVAVTQSAQIDRATAAGFSYEYSVGETSYLSKFVSIDESFGSNWDLT